MDTFEGFADAQDAPIVETIGGREFTFPLLEMADWAKMAREIQAHQKQKALSLLPLTAGDAQKQQIINFYDGKDADIDTITQYVYQLDGAEAVLVKSLAKSGLKKDQAAQVVQRLSKEKGLRGMADFAFRVSALFPPIKSLNGTVPNSQAGISPATGEETSSPSSTPATEASAA